MMTEESRAKSFSRLSGTPDPPSPSHMPVHGLPAIWSHFRQEEGTHRSRCHSFFTHWRFRRCLQALWNNGKTERPLASQRNVVLR